MRKEYKARRDTLVEGLKKIPGVIYSEPKGAFYVMAKLPVDDAEKFQLFMLEEFDDPEHDPDQRSGGHRPHMGRV